MSRLSALALVFAALCITHFIAWSNGWSSHAAHVITMADKQKQRAEKVIEPVEKQAAIASEGGKVIYRTITRDVVKYVQSPNRTMCKFDDDAVQLRQRSIDAANNISGFDATTVQGQ
ncbi:hypothetical protein [Serratia liquefaciens]|jgi:hypothetical protein|uniref:hypothetical protein n=1 Tax=Serratia liquefaciens TaxID=614 RepID=UPI0039AEF6A2